MQPLLGFVNFHLYHSINLKYPPILDPRLEALAAGTVLSSYNQLYKLELLQSLKFVSDQFSYQIF